MSSCPPLCTWPSWRPVKAMKKKWCHSQLCTEVSSAVCTSQHHCSCLPLKSTLFPHLMGVAFKHVDFISSSHRKNISTSIFRLDTSCKALWARSQTAAAPEARRCCERGKCSFNLPLMKMRVTVRTGLKDFCYLTLSSRWYLLHKGWKARKTRHGICAGEK